MHGKMASNFHWIIIKVWVSADFHQFRNLFFFQMQVF